jgi:multicomponent Na+:H+ antiporter subunit A
MPLLAIGSGLAAASLAAFPGTSGFFKDELFFADTADRGGLIAALSVAGAAITVIYAGRFWFGMFAGRVITPARALPGRLVWPIVALGIVSVVGGWWFDPILELAEDASRSMTGVEYHPHIGYTFEATDENIMALTAIGAGLLLLLTRRWWIRPITKLVWLGSVIGPERWFIESLHGLNRLSTATYRVEVRDFRSRVASVLPSAALLAGLGLAFSDERLSAVRIGTFETSDLPLVLMMAVAGLAAISATSRQDHLTLSLVLSGVGFSLAVVYALLGAPDVALVAVLVETIFTLLFLGMVSVIPSDVDPATVQVSPVAQVGPPKTQESHRLRDVLVAGIGGVFAFIVAWVTLSPVPMGDIVANDYVNLTPEAHGKDIVTVILADFRGFDTLGEITVIGIAFLGIATLLRRYRTAR